MKPKNKKTILIIAAFVLAFSCFDRSIFAEYGQYDHEFAQNPFSVLMQHLVPPLHNGGPAALEFQMVDSGWQGSLLLRWELIENNELYIAFSGNALGNRWWKIHESEVQSGIGIGSGWNHWLMPEHKGLYGGLRWDLWHNFVTWQDVTGDRNGKTDLTVFEPSVQIGWRFELNRKALTLDLLLSGGTEINIQTNGDPTGQGYLVKVGTSLGFGR